MPTPCDMLVEHIKRCDEHNDICDKTGYVTPKTGKVVYRSTKAPKDIPPLGSPYTVRGKYYQLIVGDMFGKRTVFQKMPVNLEDQDFYLELKGYGRDGRDMFFREHDEGDVFFGMYLDGVVRKLQYMQKAAEKGLHVPQPVAGVEIDREEYVKKGMQNFAEILAFEIMLDHVNQDNVQQLIGPYSHDDGMKSSVKVIRKVMAMHNDDVENSVQYIVEHLPSDSMKNVNFGLSIQGKALLSRRPVGYVIRASRCPLRVGDPSDPKIDTPENRKIARQAGYTFKSLLELGLFHICPSTGNMTHAGELTDFVDVIDPNTEMHRAYAYMDTLKKNKLLKQRAIPSFIRCIIGPPHTGVLSESFREGMYYKGISLDQAARNVYKIL